MFHLDFSAFLSSVFFHKLSECYTEETTAASYLCLFLPFYFCLPGPVNLPSNFFVNGLAGNDNQAFESLSKTSMSNNPFCTPMHESVSFHFTQLVRYSGEPVSNFFLDLSVYLLLDIWRCRHVIKCPFNEGPWCVGAGQKEVVLKVGENRL